MMQVHKCTQDCCHPAEQLELQHRRTATPPQASQPDAVCQHHPQTGIPGCTSRAVTRTTWSLKAERECSISILFSNWMSPGCSSRSSRSSSLCASAANACRGCRAEPDFTRLPSKQHLSVLCQRYECQQGCRIRSVCLACGHVKAHCSRLAMQMPPSEVQGSTPVRVDSGAQQKCLKGC